LKFLIKIYKQNSFRLKSNSDDDDDEPQSAIDTSVTPSTPIVQSGTLGAIEPSVTTVKSDFIMPVIDPKWNETVEIQLPDGRKVFFLFIKK